jgi:hypothetical protein
VTVQFQVRRFCTRYRPYEAASQPHTTPTPRLPLLQCDPLQPNASPLLPLTRVQLPHGHCSHQLFRQHRRRNLSLVQCGLRRRHVGAVAGVRTCVSRQLLIACVRSLCASYLRPRYAQVYTFYMTTLATSCQIGLTIDNIAVSSSNHPRTRLSLHCSSCQLLVLTRDATDNFSNQHYSYGSVCHLLFQDVGIVL